MQTTADNRTIAGISSALRAGQEAFLDAVGAAAGRWDEEILASEVPERTGPGLSAWSPRHASFHAVSAQWTMLDIAVECRDRARRNAPPLLHDTVSTNWYATHSFDLKALRRDMADPVRARAVAADRCNAARECLAGFMDSDLDAHWDPGEFNIGYLRTFGIEDAGPTVWTLLTMATVHLRDHAEQIARGVK